MDDLTKQFHNRWFRAGTWPTVTWRGHTALKCPMDLWVYQEIVFERKPETIIELGSKHGGTAVFLADVCATIGKGNVVSVDIEDCPCPAHDRIDWVLGDSVDGDTFRRVVSMCHGDIMVVADSDHSEEHVLKELQFYSPLVTKGQYFIVEDTNHAYIHDRIEGTPLAAVKRFLAENKDFRIDESRERFQLTFNPSGYLERI